MNVTKALAALALIAATPAIGQSAIFTGMLDETFDETVEISARDVAGLVVGPMSGRVEINALQISLPERRSGQTMCVAMTTRDGIYGAEGVFTAAPGPPIRAPLGAGSRFQRELVSYERSDLAALARVEPHCDGVSDPTLLPVRYGEGRTLTAMLQVRGAGASASLSTSLGRVEGTCRAVDGKAFNQVCSFDLSRVWVNGVAGLEVRYRERAGNRVSTSASVLLAG